MEVCESEEVLMNCIKKKKKRYKRGQYVRFKIINLIDKKVTEYKIKLKGTHANPLREFLTSIFGEFEFIDCQEWFRKDVGHPDYLLKMKLYNLYVEYKSPTDAINTSQIEWIFNNLDKKTIIVHQLD